VSFRTAWPDESATNLRHRVTKWIRHYQRATADHELLLKGGRCAPAKNLGGLASREGRGVVVFTLHHGPFYYVPLELAHVRGNVDVIMGEFQRRKSTMWDHLPRLVGAELRCLAAESATSLLAARRGLRAGHTLVIYLDGEIGARTEAAEGRSVRVEFLSLPLELRVGGLLLASRAEVPIVLALASHGRFGRREIEYSPAIAPPSDESDEAVLRSMQEILSWFEARVRAHPEQWLGWATPTVCWAEVGTAPRASVEEWHARRRQVQGLLSAPLARRRQTKLHADPTEVGLLDDDDAHVIMHGRTRRFLRGSRLSTSVLRAAYRGLPLAAGAQEQFGVTLGELTDEVVRLTLAGLCRIE